MREDEDEDGEEQLQYGSSASLILIVEDVDPPRHLHTNPGFPRSGATEFSGAWLRTTNTGGEVAGVMADDGCPVLRHGDVRSCWAVFVCIVRPLIGRARKTDQPRR